MNQLQLTLLIIGFWMIPEMIVYGEESKSPPSRIYRDNVCGPRSVLHVLRHYGQHANLFDLVKECQWPDFEKGASLAVLTVTVHRV